MKRSVVPGKDLKVSCTYTFTIHWKASNDQLVISHELPYHPLGLPRLLYYDSIEAHYLTQCKKVQSLWFSNSTIQNRWYITLTNPCFAHCTPYIVHVYTLAIYNEDFTHTLTHTHIHTHIHAHTHTHTHIYTIQDVPPKPRKSGGWADETFGREKGRRKRDQVEEE